MFPLCSSPAMSHLDQSLVTDPPSSVTKLGSRCSPSIPHYYYHHYYNHANKWFMHNPESVLENEAHKLLRDFERQTDHQISTRSHNNQYKNKEK